MRNKDAKKVYSTPKLVVYGDIDRITQGNEDGEYTDQDFPVNTARSDLTFSE